MRVLVIADEQLKKELLAGAVQNTTLIEWTHHIDDYKPSASFDACLDLLYDNSPERIKWLNDLAAPLIIINSVIVTLEEIQQDFVRINGWSTFLGRPMVEAATRNEQLKSNAVELFNLFGKKTEWVPDIQGLLTARVVASIINEAYFALQEKVSTAEEIDIAMKLGTNYPYGPFEWSRKIGLINIFSLLKELAKHQPRYQPSPLLQKSVLN